MSDRRITAGAGRRILAVLVFGLVASFAQAVDWAAAPGFTRVAPDEWHVVFEVDEYTDVEVAIVNPATSEVVRHLAAGLLGASPPPPLRANSLAQDVVWDGRDDYGLVVADKGDLAARVRAGSSVATDQIVGGDPYGWFSYENGENDHYAWGMTQAIDAKPDGNVFIYANSGPLGSPMIRQYDATGHYIKTVFPFPAGHEMADVEGWGIRVKADGSYAPVFSDFTWQPTISDSYVVHPHRTHIGTLIADPHDNGSLTVMTTQPQGDGPLFLQTLHTDGSIPKLSKLGRLINTPALPKKHARIEGNFFTALSHDGKYLYLSSLYDKIGFDDPGNFYRDGQVFKVDRATGTASSFYDQGATVAKSAGVNRKRGFSQLHGLAVDSQGNVFVCDRMQGQIVVLSSSGVVLRKIPVAFPDNVAVSAAGVLYVTTRETHAVKGEVLLHKFDDWSKAAAPSDTVQIARITNAPDSTDVQIAGNGGDPRIWVSYPSAPVKIYSDGPGGLVLERDFSQLNTQKNLAINSVQVDSKTETLYVTDAFNTLFKVDDWAKPVFERCLTGEGRALTAGSIAIDERNRYLYARGGTSRGPIERWALDSAGYYRPLNTAAGSNQVTDDLWYGWFIRTGHADTGFDVAPDGSLAISGGLGSTKDLNLKYFNRDEKHTPWSPLVLDPRPATGAKVDLQGNIYVAIYDGPPSNIPRGYESDPFYRTSKNAPLISRIYKYAPTGSIASGNLYPTAPAAAARIYDVPYGMTAARQPASFGVDGYGRIAYPTAISQTVTLIDNAGNEILRFGTYGNPDSKGGLPGEQVPTIDIPLAYGHTVDISDDFVYVGDLNNNRVLRLALRHRLNTLLRSSDSAH
jgi:hypothetical protein